jgi:hypothetical protein
MKKILLLLLLSANCFAEITSDLLPFFRCDLESERSASWPEGSIVFCADTGKTYRLTNSVFYDMANAVDSKASVGLGDVDNTSDANKPVSLAQQAALNLKANMSDSLPGITRQWYIQQQAGAISTIAVGMITPTINGTGTVFESATGQFINFASAAMINRDAGWISSAFTQVQRRQTPIWECRMRTGALAADLIDARIHFGLFSANPSAASLLVATHGAEFRYATDIDGTAFWRCVTSDGTLLTTTITTTPITIDTNYVLKIDMSDTGQVVFSINGVIVATHTTNLPSLTQSLGHAETIRNISAGAHNIRLSRLFVSQL